MRGSVGCGQGAAPVRAACGRDIALRAGMLGTVRSRGQPLDHCVHSVRPSRRRPAGTGVRSAAVPLGGRRLR
ncbi:hypothetical protein EZV63_01845 [Streptomyces sp. VN1]|nr:hypothetical protein EZV63_01845 [Streptomyces sp. VN1]